MSTLEEILRVRDLRKFFPIKGTSLLRRKKRYIRAVDGVSFHINRGETFGIVGESGCGKTTLARVLLRLTEPSGGQIYYDGQNITALDKKGLKELRRKLQMIFQDPYSSLDPRKTIFNIVAEPLKVHRVARGSALDEKIKEALALVDLPTSRDFLEKVPDELSGGQRQRVGIARALVLGVEFIVADEPVSMLDASVKAGVTSLLMDLKHKIGLTYVFITHEIGLAYYTCDRIAVMYLGKIVELGKAESVIKSPLHPYTRLLMDAIPPLLPDEQWGKRVSERGEMPLSLEAPKGCRFHPRCAIADEGCLVDEPVLKEITSGHYVACSKPGRK
ncbi:MAG: ABC transporter ATP-binding protein [Deltaproteobacteria bacterium]|nr:ABC transporter ATP-binding protein [Deltaproteobacteria bacterium]